MVRVGLRSLSAGGPDFDWNGSSKTYGTPLMARALAMLGIYAGLKYYYLPSVYQCMVYISISIYTHMHRILRRCMLRRAQGGGDIGT